MNLVKWRDTHRHDTRKKDRFHTWKISHVLAEKCIRFSVPHILNNTNTHIMIKSMPIAWLVLLIMLKYTFWSTPINALLILIAMFGHKSIYAVLIAVVLSFCSDLYNHIWDHHHLPSTVCVPIISHLSSLFCDTIYLCISCMSSCIVILYFVICFVGGCHESDSWDFFDISHFSKWINDYYYKYFSFEA